MATFSRTVRRRGLGILDAETKRLRELFGRAGGNVFQGLRAQDAKSREGLDAIEQLAANQRQELGGLAREEKASAMDPLGSGGLEMQAGLSEQLALDLDAFDTQAAQVFGEFQSQRNRNLSLGQQELAGLGALQADTEIDSIFGPKFGLFTGFGTVRQKGLFG